jgi:hypothetical protein
VKISSVGNSKDAGGNKGSRNRNYAFPVTLFSIFILLKGL